MAPMLLNVLKTTPAYWELETGRKKFLKKFWLDFEESPSFVKNWLCAILYKEVRDGVNDYNDDDNDDLNQTIFIHQEQNILLMGSFFLLTEVFLFIWSWNADNRYWKLWVLEEELWFPQLWICCKKEVCNSEEQQLSGTIRGSVKNMLMLSWEALV